MCKWEHCPTYDMHLCHNFHIKNLLGVIGGETMFNVVIFEYSTQNYGETDLSEEDLNALSSMATCCGPEYVRNSNLTLKRHVFFLVSVKKHSQTVIKTFCSSSLIQVVHM